MAKALRFRFSRGQELKYIAHLDMLGFERHQASEDSGGLY